MTFSAKLTLQRALQRLLEDDTLLENYNVKEKTCKRYTVEYKECVVSISTIFGIRGTSVFVKASSPSICRWKQAKKHPAATPNRTNKHYSAITDVMVCAIQLLVIQKPFIRAHEIKTFLKDYYNVNVSRQLVQVVLSKRMGLTFKRTKKRGRGQVEDPEYNARKDHFTRRFKHAISDESKVIVSIDESGFDERAKPLYGYSKRGTSAIIYQPCVSVSPHVRTSLLMAIGSDGTICHELHRQNIDGNTFADFILTLTYSPGALIILDNHSMHDVENVRVAMIVKGYDALFIPPHSPEFNPIEMVFGTLKNEFYRLRYSNMFKTVSETIESLIEKHAQPEKVQRYFRHVFDLMNSIQDDKSDLGGIQFPNANSEHRWDGNKRLKITGKST